MASARAHRDTERSGGTSGGLYGYSAADDPVAALERAHAAARKALELDVDSRLASFALAKVSGLYFVAHALDALARGDYDRAVEHALRIDAADWPMGRWSSPRAPGLPASARPLCERRNGC